MLTPYTRNKKYNEIVRNAEYKLHCKNCQKKNQANDSVLPFYIDHDTLVYAQGIILCDYCDFPCDDDFTNFTQQWNLIKLKTFVLPKYTGYEIILYWQIDKQDYTFINQYDDNFFADYPVLYDDNTIAWNFPERLPELIKRYTQKLMIKTKG